MQNDNQIISIKGTKDGLIFHINDEASYQDVILQLEEVLASVPHTDQQEKAANVTLQLGYRHVSPEQKKQLREMVEKDNHFFIEKFDSKVISREKAKQWFEEHSLKSISQIVRSGQVLDIEGDLLLIGDVNPGGEVRATGDIYILGKLHGIAHAGTKGNDEAVIAASYMNPNQLRISQYISRATDYETEGVYMECGYLDKENEKIVIDRLQVLPYVQRKLRKLKGGMYDG